MPVLVLACSSGVRSGLGRISRDSESQQRRSTSMDELSYATMLRSKSSWQTLLRREIQSGSSREGPFCLKTRLGWSITFVTSRGKTEQITFFCGIADFFERKNIFLIFVR
jgi:hypothetical protein